MAEQSEFTIRQILELAECFDVPEVQREVVSDARWCAAVIDSLFQEIPVGAPLLYEAHENAGRLAGRYRGTSSACWWIINGQQRLTAVLAAFGRRPPWIPDETWLALGGARREVAVRFTKTGAVSFHPYKPGAPLQIRLSDLLSAAESNTVHRLLARTSVPYPAQYVERLAALAERLLGMRVKVDWLHGDMDKAVTAFIRHNQAGASKRLAPEEYRLATLSIRCPGLQRDVIDPEVRAAADAGFAWAFGRPRIVAVMEHLLPRGATQVANQRRLDPADVTHAAEQAALGCAAAVDYLHGCGITGDEVLCPPSAAEVLGALFARFPKEAAGDDFAGRWLLHLAARGTYHALDHPHRADARAVADAAHYRDAVRLLAARIPAGPIPPWDRDMLHFAGQGRAAFGRAGTVFALACRACAAGRITDLGDPGVVLGDARLQLRPLWRMRPGQRPSLAQLAWMTEDTHTIVQRAGGWGRDAYEALACPDSALAAQYLTKPVPTLDPGAEIARRASAIHEMVNDFLAATEPLHPAPTPVPAQLPVAV